MKNRPHVAPVALVLTVVVLACTVAAPAAARDRKKKPGADPYADYVWPPPPDKARIKLEAVISGRADVEGESKLAKALIGVSPKTPWDDLHKPFAVAFDPRGRILVTDSGSGALLRFDLAARKVDVLGTGGAQPLRQPLGLDVGPDGTAYVADVGQARVFALDPEGKLRAVYGQAGELENPTDAALSPDGKRLFVADSKASRIVIFDAASGARLGDFGKAGAGPGEFSFPTSLAFGPEGDLFVVDQLNCRVQVLSADGEFRDQFGGQGTGVGKFVRPKDVAVDQEGLIYVTDTAFNNVQIFAPDYLPLTFVGSAGETPGHFLGASGVGVSGDRFAVVDQLGHRLQVFRFVVPKTAK